MKKVLLLAMSFCMLNAGYSVYGGMAMTKAANSEAMEGMTDEFTPSFTVGASMDAGPVVVGAGFSQRVMAMKMDMEGIDWTSKGTHNYLEFWAAYPYAAGPVVLYGGMMLGMPMGDATMSVELDGVELMSETMSGEDANRASLDYGLMFGASYPFNDKMSLSAGYYLGLADIADERMEGDDGSTKWNSLMVTAGYNF